MSVCFSEPHGPAQTPSPSKVPPLLTESVQRSSLERGGGTLLMSGSGGPCKEPVARQHTQTRAGINWGSFCRGAVWHWPSRVNNPHTHRDNHSHICIFRSVPFALKGVCPV
ncbi:hypothetical protein AGIG_G24767 [Arapaima gigas]